MSGIDRNNKKAYKTKDYSCRNSRKTSDSNNSQIWGEANTRLTEDMSGKFRKVNSFTIAVLIILVFRILYCYMYKCYMDILVSVLFTFFCIFYLMIF